MPGLRLALLLLMSDAGARPVVDATAWPRVAGGAFNFIVNVVNLPVVDNTHSADLALGGTVTALDKVRFPAHVQTAAVSACIVVERPATNGRNTTICIYIHVKGTTLSGLVVPHAGVHEPVPTAEPMHLYIPTAPRAVTPAVAHHDA